MTYYMIIEVVRQEFNYDRSRRLNKHTVLGHTGLRRAVAASATQAGDSNWIRNSFPSGIASFTMNKGSAVLFLRPWRLFIWRVPPRQIKQRLLR